MGKDKGNIQIRYWKRFLVEPKFRDRNKYVKGIAKKASVIHQDDWTKMRFIGPMTILFDQLNPWLGIAFFIFFGFTDFLDGLVARFKKEEDNKRGALLDGWADKVLIIPTIWYWGYEFVGHLIFFVLIFIEFFGNMIIGAVAWSRGETEKKELFKHAFVGKLKMCLQFILCLFFWYAKHFFSAWKLWPEIFSYAIHLIILLATLSIVIKLNNNLK